MTPKSESKDPRMSEAATIDERMVGEAVDWAVRLVDTQSRGPGDGDNATRLVAHLCGVGYWTIWALRRPSRRPKSVRPSLWLKLQIAWAAECARQAQFYDEERRRTEGKTWLGRELIRQADYLAGSEDGVVK